MFIVLSRSGADVVATDPETGNSERITDVAEYVRRREPERPRWVWDDTSRWYPELLDHGVRVERCHDLRLCHTILRNSVLTAESRLALSPRSSWDAPPAALRRPDTATALFALDDDEPIAPPDSVAEFAHQQEAVAASEQPGRSARLLAAESAGALIAVEMAFCGLPWRADEHDRILEDLLGPRPAAGERPARLAQMVPVLRDLLEAPDLNPDSPVDLLKALRNTGMNVKSTGKWELREIKHPVIEPLLEYKRMARLLSANGWHWLDTWITDGRFRPVYVPGGVVTGRWASDGGGALQLPKQVRGAVIADDGWKLVVADASQLEPRILAALAGDRDMVAAGSAGDLYAGIVASGAVETRDQAKVAMLGAMYGATTGESGRLMPKLARAYPRAIGMVEEAARAGERGEIVTTRLGRSSPLPGSEWLATQSQAYGESASEADTSRARGSARAWGRFTRNFIVQGSAAEWALCWMASIRRRLTAMSGDAWLTHAPHLVFFLHDEVVVHCPEHLSKRVEEEIRAAAVEAGTLLFGELPAEFPVTVAIVDNYGQAK
ncbi:MAG: bifunctional 3'-5' exonuclease/DNA polymerase [Rhodoglobus sp.]